MPRKTLMFMTSTHGHELSGDLWYALSADINFVQEMMFSGCIFWLFLESKCHNPQLGYDCFQHKQIQAGFGLRV